ncbi:MULTISPECIES: multidrug resistance efflux transporter family protein [Psychrobacter]|jgi:drug/metabolite transporter (DMT)-like permease|uniref:multidrug resistance efflux transporter family protein n=1 Tax=Psychrobacter TaxID=497 RepID=UPI0008699ACF|nr:MULTISPECIES: multidrug resistance efflux transporter family protein [Psychrobacter]MBA6244540.1 multidrug resistance efflux transporter family protein [Psychrobacter sp. Urea-trap-18]MBA6285890.1 multidrug resistance efflux transporter family protein [Psychrobacter sp. Urea-trap-16]MBA6317532.1 multidrug resistance efflux transporter family protein [Psychrobacter sp. Urea-trap-20]MBA6333257.1 multidrug resistance efflux transporter family protein [Psychrobacter sp. Urea-trap-19]OEH67088.1 |tara:strand:+ start:43443 stop:44600 length:1158 start_codon:yes stop_codon:yes gene_type:complete
MIKLILLGLLAGAFFSSTFILNELMSSAGGHWFWSASLRYVFMLLIITVIIAIQHGFGRIKALMRIFLQHWGFWCITGSIGFGLFYTGICYAADHVAGWVVAATFMFTVVASLLVLLAFGQRFDKKFIVYAVIVFIGVALVNISEGLHAAAITDTVPMSDMLLYGALPALIAAFSYPIGNQLVWQASHNARQRNTELQKAAEFNDQKASISISIDISEQNEPLISEAYDLPATTYDATDLDSVLQSNNTAATSSLQNLIARIPSIETTLLQNAFNKVWLMTLGCLPFWLFLGIIVRPDQPHASQIINTLLVALLAGVAATTIFLYAREQAVTSSEVAGVDSTQASEVIFALIGGILLLGNAIPSAMGLVGIGLIMVGLILFAKDG